MAKELYDKTGDKSLTGAFVFDFLGRTLIALSEAYEERFGKSNFVYAGGVMCNSIIKKMLSERFTAYFAEPRLSSDNAVGVAALALRAYKRENSL
jgi:N6-L-threonylcarbamoyladenine synthase